jgi:hypothetical protein
MWAVNGGPQMIPEPVAVERCSFRSEVVIPCLWPAIATWEHSEACERHHQAQRYQTSSFALRSS